MNYELRHTVTDDIQAEVSLANLLSPLRDVELPLLRGFQIDDTFSAPSTHTNRKPTEMDELLSSVPLILNLPSSIDRPFPRLESFDLTFMGASSWDRHDANVIIRSEKLKLGPNLLESYFAVTSALQSVRCISLVTTPSPSAHTHGRNVNKQRSGKRSLTLGISNEHPTLSQLF